jgi:thioredoxin reductase
MPQKEPQLALGKSCFIVFQCISITTPKPFELCGIKTHNEKAYPNEKASTSEPVARAPLETSIAGVFAIGDVRAASTKRVASAVGEGAQVVAAIQGLLGDKK